MARLVGVLACAAALALVWPVAGAGYHLRPSATVSAAVTELRGADTWVVELRWTASCQGASDAAAEYDGDLWLVDLDSGERTYVGGVVAASGVRERRVIAIARQQRLRPELLLTCSVAFPQDGSPELTFTGDPVTVPARLRGAGAGGGLGGGDGGGGGDPAEPLQAGGCRVAVLGTNDPDALTGGEAGEIVVGFGGADRLRGEGGHDCLVGGPGADRLTGGDGADRIVGGRGRDVLIGGDGVNAYDAGGGSDVVRARNGRPESVRCGPGRDRAYVDRRDRVSGCELTLVGVGR